MNIVRGLLFALLILPLLELYLLIKLIGALGFILTLALLLAAAAAGMALLRTQSLATWLRVQAALARGDSPTREVVETGLVALSGLLLLFPGFLSDLLALGCLIPASRRRLAIFLLEQGPHRPPKVDESRNRMTIEGEFRREE